MKLVQKGVLSTRTRADQRRVRVIDIEGHKRRYGSQWRYHFSAQLKRSATTPGASVTVLSGKLGNHAPRPGEFINFATTGLYKTSQGARIFQLFAHGEVKAGDVFVFFDAWNPIILMVRYASELLRIPVRIVVLWHSGSYDSADLLAQRIKDKKWSLNAERAIFNAADINCFATTFSCRLFVDGVRPESIVTARRVGWPMEYLADLLEPFARLPKRNVIVFPHRLSAEKQPEIFRDLAREFPDYEFRVCQEEGLTKKEYHTLLGSAKAVFSANLQETLGIGIFEGMRCGAAPIVPDRLSYGEMYASRWRYPSVWTESAEAHRQFKPQLVAFVRSVLDEYDRDEAAMRARLRAEADTVSAQYFNGSALYAEILR